MKTSILIFFLLTISNFSIFSQSSKDKAFLLIRYDETSITDSTDLLKKNYDVMGLEIGKTMSRFYSISLLETIKVLEEQIKQTGSIDFRNLSTPKSLFWNYRN